MSPARLGSRNVSGEAPWPPGAAPASAGVPRPPGVPPHSTSGRGAPHSTGGAGRARTSKCRPLLEGTAPPAPRTPCLPDSLPGLACVQHPGPAARVARVSCGKGCFCAGS